MVFPGFIFNFYAGHAKGKNSNSRITSNSQGEQSGLWGSSSKRKVPGDRAAANDNSRDGCGEGDAVTDRGLSLGWVLYFESLSGSRMHGRR